MLTQIFLHWFCLPVLRTPPKRRDCLLSIQRKLVSRYHLCQHPFSLSSYFFLNKKKYSMLASIVVRCSHQSDRRIRVFISYQSYHSVWISCTNYSIWVFFSVLQILSWYQGLSDDLNHKFWAHVIGVMVCGLRRLRSGFIGIWKVCIQLFIIFKLRLLLYSEN